MKSKGTLTYNNVYWAPDPPNALLRRFFLLYTHLRHSGFSCRVDSVFSTSGEKVPSGLTTIKFTPGPVRCTSLHITQ